MLVAVSSVVVPRGPGWFETAGDLNVVGTSSSAFIHSLCFPHGDDLGDTAAVCEMLSYKTSDLPPADHEAANGQ